MNFALIITILVAGQICSAAPAGEEVEVPFNEEYRADLIALCSGQDDRLTLTDQVHFFELCAGTKDEPSCASELSDAMSHLATVIGDDKNSFCHMKKVNDYLEFYHEYLDESSKRQLTLPKSLRRFALAYGMQLSSYCSLDMMKYLMLAPKDIAIDIRRLESEWTCDGGAVDNMLAEVARPGKVVLPGDLVEVYPATREPLEKLASQVYAKSAGIKDLCSKRFEVIYKQVVDPVATLLRAGFDLATAELKLDSAGVNELNKQMTRWSRVIFLCESLKLISPAAPAADDKHKDQSNGAYIKAPYVKPRESIMIENTLIPNYDKDLIRLLNSFDTSKQRNELTQETVTRSIVEARQSRGMIKSLSRKLSRGLSRSGKSCPAEPELVKMLKDALKDAPLPQKAEPEPISLAQVAEEVGLTEEELLEEMEDHGPEPSTE